MEADDDIKELFKALAPTREEVLAAQTHFQQLLKAYEEGRPPLDKVEPLTEPAQEVRIGGAPGLDAFGLLSELTNAANETPPQEPPNTVTEGVAPVNTWGTVHYR